MNNKVFISTGHYKYADPTLTLKKFLKENIYDIEFSGGLPMSLKNEKKFFNKLENYEMRLHNYFPPPKKKFVINLASRDEKILKKSIKHIKKSIVYSKKINAKFFSFHAGFRIDPHVNKLGRKFNKVEMTRKNMAEKIFLDSVKKISAFALKHGIKILIENNVINKKNLFLFKGNPMLLTHPTDIINFFKKTPNNVELLLDVGHLKVSSKTEGFHLTRSMKKLNKIVSGYHLSDNDFKEDKNLSFTKNSWFIKYLKKDLEYYTIEVYDKNISKLKKIKNFLEKILNN